jgi:hypothetical protein
MKNSMARGRVGTRGRRACVALTLGLSLGALAACESLLEVDLPSRLTDAALDEPVAAQTMLNSAIGQFEDAYSEMTWQMVGHTAGGEIVSASGGTNSGYTTYGTSNSGYTGMSVARSFAYQLHDKLEKTWTDAQVANRPRMMAMSSIYAGAAIGWMGSSLCEVTIDAGELMTADQTLALADQWLSKALTEITATGDFAMPYGIASSARSMTYGLKAQVLWMKGDKPGALAAAAQVPKGFYAYVGRESGPTRRNLTYAHGVATRYLELYDVVDFWQGDPNPVTGKPWPAVIPFTGYRNLGILPDGRAVRDDGLPIRTAGLHRTAIENTAVRDTRVNHGLGSITAITGTTYYPIKYNSEADDIPMVNWREIWLIRAEIEGGQKAIDLVNEIRAADNLPLVTYASPANAEQIRYMIIEEKRRVLYLEARYFFTEIKNTDILWFPRNSGRSLRKASPYGGGVRFLMPGSEFTNNPNLTPALRATGCPAGERPVGF